MLICCIDSPPSLVMFYACAAIMKAAAHTMKRDNFFISHYIYIILIEKTGGKDTIFKVTRLGYWSFLMWTSIWLKGISRPFSRKAL